MDTPRLIGTLYCVVLAAGRSIRCVGGLVPCLSVAAVCLPASPSSAQPAGDVQAMYDDALNQLRVAQDRKNELAMENERLAARVGTLQAQIATLEARLRELEGQLHQAASEASQADSLRQELLAIRARQALWERFVDARPHVQAAWQRYTRGGLISWVSRSDVDDVPADGVMEAGERGVRLDGTPAARPLPSVTPDPTPDRHLHDLIDRDWPLRPTT